jgi:invasion protein IalB
LRGALGGFSGAAGEGNIIMAICILARCVRPWNRLIGHARIRGAAAPIMLALLAAAVSPVAVSPAAAQGVVRSVYGDWQIRCETPPGAHNEQCALMQVVTAEDRPNVNLSVIVLKTADLKARLMRVVAPLGVMLPCCATNQEGGLGLKIDNHDVGRVGFIKCLLNGCIAEVTMNDNLINQLRNGQTATFIIFQTPEEGIGFPMSLKGFGEGYDHLP